MAGITVPIDGDLSPILATFAELPGRTQEEMAAVGEVIAREARRGAIAKGFAEVEGVSAASAKRAANAVIREMERAAQETKRANEAAAREAAAAAKAAEREIERAMETAAREAAHAAREVERAMEHAQRESNAKLTDLRKGATVAFGGVVGDIEDVVGALSAMGPVAIAAGVALGAFAVGGAIVGGMVELERAATGALERLDNLGVPVDPALRDSILEANASLDALWVIVDEVVVQLAASFGPAIVEAATELGILGIQFSNLVEETLKTQSAMDFLITYLTSTFLQGIFVPISAVAQLAEGVGRLGEMVGLQDNVLKRAGQGYDDLTWSLSQSILGVNTAENKIDDFNGVLLDSGDAAGSFVAAYGETNGVLTKTAADAMSAGTEFERLTKRIREHQAAAKSLTSQEKERTEARKKTKEATVDLAAWDEKYYADQERAAEKWRLEQERINKQNDEAQTKAAENRAAASDAQAAADAERNRQAAEDKAKMEAEESAQRKQAAIDYFNTGAQASEMLAQVVSDNAKEGTKLQKDAAMVAFRINQATALANIGIKTGEAVMSVAAANPPPSPLFFIGEAATLAMGIAQAAAVAAQAPPSFHTGGVISSNPLAPDETMIRARKGEEVRTRQDQGAQSPIVVQMTYQHRVFDTFVADNMKQTSSPLRREITSRSGRLLGHRERAR